MPPTLRDDRLDHYLQLIDDLALSSLKTEYAFATLEDFEIQMETSVRDAMHTYWREMLYRCHFSSVAAILRTRHWFSAISDSIARENALSFAASLRCCMESAADSAASLRAVPLALAVSNAEIATALEGSLDTVTFNTELENELIHFSHARFISSEEKGDTPRTHKTRPMRNYLEILTNGGVPRVGNLYRTLSDLVHPAASTVFMWLEHSGKSARLSAHQDMAIVKGILDNHGSILLELAMFGFNPAIITLKILNRFSISELHTPPLEDWNLSGIKGWSKCDALFSRFH